MERKQAEADFANMMGRLRTSTEGKIWCHKWTDMRMCPHCHELLYKSENMVDYMIVAWNYASLVECKQGEDSFPFADENAGLRPNQRAWLSEWELFGRPSWLFLELGTGRAPNDRNAWLIPWTIWLYYESQLEVVNRKSMPWRPNRQSKGFDAVGMLKHYQLNWVPTKGFVIPTPTEDRNHFFWARYDELN